MDFSPQETFVLPAQGVSGLWDCAMRWFIWQISPGHIVVVRLDKTRYFECILERENGGL